MPKDDRSPLVGYALAAAFVATAFLLKFLFARALGEGVPFLMFFAASALSAWFGGLGPGLAATIAGGVLGAYFFLPPARSLVLTPSGYLQFAVFVIEGVVLCVVTDTLRRSRAEAAAREARLGESEARFRTLADTAPVMIWTSDAARRCDYVNKPWLDFTGRAPGQELGDGWADGIHPDDRARRLEVFDASFDARRPFTAEYRLRRHDGRYRWLLESGAPRFAPGGEFLGYVGSCIDIHERKTVEESLRRWEHIFRHAGWAVAVASPDGTLVFVNDAFARMHGRTAEAMVGTPLADTFAPEDRDKVGEYARVVHERGEFVYESTHVRADGSRFVCLTHVTAFKSADGRVLFRAGTFQDISELRRAQEAECAQREQLQVTLESIGDAVVVTDRVGTVTFLNPVAEQLTGWRREQAEGQPLRNVFPIFSEDTGTPVEDPVSRVLREGQVVGLGNHTVLRSADGAERPIEDSAAPVRDESGAVRGVVLVFRDVGERRQAENAIRESEARKAAVLDTALDGIITIDDEGRVLEFNPAAERIFGRARADVLGLELADLVIPPGPADGGRRGLEVPGAAGGADGLGRLMEVTARRADGSEFPAEVAVTRVPLPGPPVYTAYVRDFSERKRAERRRNARLAVTQTLAESLTLREAAPGLLRALGEGLDWDVAALWIPDARANVLRCQAFWSRPDLDAAEFEAASQAQVLAKGVGVPGRVWAAATPVWFPDLQAEVSFPRAPSARRAGLHGAFGFPILLGPKTIGVVEVFSAAVREPDPDLLEMVATLGSLVGQFIERRRLFDALEAERARFEAVLQQMPAGVVIADAGERALTLVNRQAGEILRYPLAVGTAFPLPEERAVRPDGSPYRPDEVPLARALSGGEVVIGEEIEYLCGDGTRKTLGVSATPVRDGDGRVVAGVAVFHDRTERKRAERALRDADRHKDEYLAMLAHELRNPLAPIRTVLEVFKHEDAPAAVRDQAREMAERQVGYMARMLDDLLDVARLSRGGVKLRRRAVDAAALVDRAAGPVRAAIDARRQRLTVAVPPGPTLIDGDPMRLEQVLTNLLGNASKYTDPGGGIHVAAEHDGADVVLRVRDTGIGIAREMLPKIFDLFVQAERRLDRSQGGVGIGLTLVKRLVELHGGAVEARSDGPGLGSEFVIRLPAWRGGPTADGEPAREARPPGPARRGVLVVDDNEDAAATLAMLLRIDGHDVRVAHDGPSALEAAAEFRPEVVFLDIGMPGMDGFEVARRLRARPEFKDTTIAALTGWGLDEDRRRTREAGFDQHLVKPADLEALRAVLAAPARTA